MICPRCGKVNYENSPECSNCFYKFRFGYGFNDPSKGDPWFYSRAINSGDENEEEINPTRSIIVTIGLIIMAIAIGFPIFFVIVMTILGRISY